MSEHDELLEDLEKLQDRCQRGISGRGEKLYYAVNDFCADVYGKTGAAAAAIRELQKENDTLRHLNQVYKNHGSKKRNERLVRKLMEARRQLRPIDGADNEA